LRSKVWLMPAAQAELRDLVQCVHAARGYDMVAWLYGRLLGVFQTLPHVFVKALVMPMTPLSVSATSTLT
jgi:hypothetical protein